LRGDTQQGFPADLEEHQNHKLPHASFAQNSAVFAVKNQQQHSSSQQGYNSHPLN
jgi:hypothetical protein